MSQSFSDRADRLFETACEFARRDAKIILAEHSAKGLLRSGATVTRVVSAFEQRSYVALDEALASVSVRIDHRGCKWRKALGEIDAAIDRHMDRAPDLIGDYVQVALRKDSPVLEALLAAIRSGMHQRLADYREGWTAPPGKPWRERYAVLYAVLLILAGALIGEGAKQVFDRSAPQSKNTGSITGGIAAPPH
ncbi:MAG: hypothetical protein MUF47_08840 [Porphyrobacter sp.]|nr:hypothetical protein [Porphyrobacter sp.]